MKNSTRQKFLKLLFIALVGMSVQMAAQNNDVCSSIPFKSNNLPKEKTRVSPCGLRTIFIPRSQGSDTARHIAGWQEYLPGCDERAWGNISLTLEYTHSFKGERLAQYLFGSTCLNFSGSQVQNRRATDLMADYFGLPTNFVGSICFDPRIDNIILDFNYHIGLDAWCPGLYFRFFAPIVVTRWDLGINCKEKDNIGPQDAPVFPTCYMSTPPAATLLSIKDALSGNAIFGDMNQPLTFGAFPCGRQMKTGIANLECIFGFNFVQNECSHAGIYIDTFIPTGTRPHSKTIFEPMVGNGNMWEIGPGVSAHYDLIRSGCHIFSVYLEGSLTHMFKRFQIRSFDLVGHGPLNRYMLLKQFNSDNTYAGMLDNVIDFSTHSVQVGGSAKLDASIKATYYYDRWGFDAGYNIYARSKEKLRIDLDLFPSDLNNRSLGIKGTEGVCFRVFNTTTGQLTDQTGVLNSTQHRSTINHGAAVDNPEAITLDPGLVAITWDSPTTPGDLIIAQQSNPPIILGPGSIDITSAAVPHQLTHKFFAHFGYTALDREWEPQVGVGVEVEFDGRSKLLSSLNQWGIWFKGALSF